jgi:acyl-CoA synthetase (AMP-forming)/AMP-acid ligase II
MPSTLDRQLDDAVAALTGPDGMIATVGPVGNAIAARLPATLPGFFRTFCGLHRDKEALVAGAERLTFARLGALSDRLAGVLVGAWGVAKGDRVAIAMRNAPAWVVCYMAVLKAGGIVTLVNGWWEQAELGQALALTAPMLVLADGERAARVRAADGAIRLVTLAVDQPIDAALAPLLTGSAGALPEMAAGDDASILFTSGSTGGAKGAVSTHRAATTAVYNFMTQTIAQRDVLIAAGTPPRDPVTLIAVPLFHVTGAMAVMLNSFGIGRRMVLMRKWDAGEALRLVEAERVTYFCGVPTMSLELMQHPDRARHDVTTLADIVAGGAARPIAHVGRLRAAFPDAHPMLGYGLTETNAVGCTNVRGNYLAKPGSTGRAQLPFVEVTVIGADDAPLPAGTRGEVAIRSAANVRGYWRDEAATAAAFTADGRLRTGDIGYLDEDGYLFIVDRAKDIIIRGGENISCQEVEAALYAHPAVAEACVFGIADDRLGETPAAVIHLEPGVTVDAATLHAFVAGRIARFKLPSRTWFSGDPLPKLGTGKIDKPGLRAAYAPREPEVESVTLAPGDA